MSKKTPVILLTIVAFASLIVAAMSFFGAFNERPAPTPAPAFIGSHTPTREEVLDAVAEVEREKNGCYCASCGCCSSPKK